MTASRALRIGTAAFAVALAGVLVYRFITDVVPIIVGTVWYLIWRSRPNGEQLVVSERAGGPVRSRRDAVH